MQVDKVERQEFRGVCLAVVSAKNEEVRADLGGRVTETVVNLIGLDLVPSARVETEDVDVVEGHVAVTAADDNEFAVDKIRGVITSSDGHFPATLEIAPLEAREVIDIECVDVVERADAVSSAKDDKLSLIVVARVRASWTRSRAADLGLGPPQRHCVKDVQVVKVIGAVTACKDEETLVDHGRRVRAASWRNVAGNFGLGPAHGLGVETP